MDEKRFFLISIVRSSFQLFFFFLPLPLIRYNNTLYRSEKRNARRSFNNYSLSPTIFILCCYVCCVVLCTYRHSVSPEAFFHSPSASSSSIPSPSIIVQFPSCELANASFKASFVIFASSSCPLSSANFASTSSCAGLITNSFICAECTFDI